MENINLTKSKTTILPPYILLLVICSMGTTQYLMACDTTPAISVANTTDIGGGFFTLDVQVCIGDGSEDGFGVNVTCGLNITATSSAMLTNSGQVATSSFPGGNLLYTWPGFPSILWEPSPSTNPCFNFTITVDGDPAGCDLRVNGINDGCSNTVSGGIWTTPIPGPPPSCGDNFFDPGGVGSNYGNNDLETYTICPDVPGDDVTINFSAFNLESGWDYLYVWDGNSASGGADFSLTGTTVPGSITATNPTGCLTLRFDSDGSITRSGFEASISCPTVLPVELISFTGNYIKRSKANQLTWKTASEINNDYFILERGVNSDDQINWKEIKYQSGAGNSTKLLSYVHLDYNPQFNVVNYYRLKQVDFDGAIKYSQTIAINNHSQNDYEISDLYPNPTNRQFSFEISNKTNSESMSLHIYNSLGKLIKSDKSLDTQNRLNFDVTDLSEGVYFVHINIADSKQIKKLTIVR